MTDIGLYDMTISLYTVISIMVLLSTVLSARTVEELYRAMLITTMWPMYAIYLVGKNIYKLCRGWNI